MRTSYSGSVKTDTLESYHERLARVLAHIEGHLDEPLPLDDLAAVACFSPYHFHRVFRGMVGESVKEHVRRLRLERDARRLLSGDSTVLALALDAGYETPESFTRAFDALFGLAPSTISKHLSILYQAGLVESRKDGRWMYYSLPDKAAPAAVRQAIDWVFQSLADTPRARDDARRLKAILNMDPVQLCKRQCRR